MYVGVEYECTSIAICTLEITLRLLVKVDFRSSFFRRDPGRLNRRAADQAMMKSIKHQGS